MRVKTKPRAYHSEIRNAAADATREKILSAARTLLSGGKGLPAFSLDGVARHAGVTRLTVYNQFESKRGLLEAVFDQIAEQGGLFSELPAVFTEPDPHRSLRRLVAVFCHFWAAHGSVFPKFSALARLDEEIAASVHERTERRRHALSALVERLDVPTSVRSDLIDTLFALTSFEMHAALAINQRSEASIEAILQALAEAAVRRSESNGAGAARAGKRRQAR